MPQVCCQTRRRRLQWKPRAQSKFTGHWLNTWLNILNALVGNITGTFNTANGVGAMQSNTNGSQNVASGYSRFHKIPLMLSHNGFESFKAQDVSANALDNRLGGKRPAQKRRPFLLLHNRNNAIVHTSIDEGAY